MMIEKVRYRVDWPQFRKGYSFFVPCIEVEEAKQELAMIARRLDMELVVKVVIENGLKGLRVWRI